MENVDNINIYSIGSGLDFPIKLSTPLGDDGNPIQIPNENEVMVNLVTCKPLVGSFDLIKQNILAILNTPLSFQLRNEFFGSRIHELIEEPNAQATEFLLKDYIKESISIWETRVKITQILTKSFEGVVLVKLKLNLVETEQENEFEFNYDTINNLIYVNE